LVLFDPTSSLYRTNTDRENRLLGRIECTGLRERKQRMREKISYYKLRTSYSSKINSSLYDKNKKDDIMRCAALKGDRIRHAECSLKEVNWKTQALMAEKYSDKT